MKKYLALLLALLMLSGCASPAPAETTAATETQTIPTTEAVTAPAAETLPPTTVPENAVHVSTVDEFLAALGSEKFIVLDPGTYDLTTASDYGAESDNPAYCWFGDEYMDGFQLELTDIHDTVILGSGKENTTILTHPRLVNVLALRDVAGITLESLTVGHSQGGEMCTGGVIHLENAEEIALRDLGLYGCGTVGAELWDSSKITVDSCDIYDCSNSGVAARYSSLINIQNTRIHDLGRDYGAAHAAFDLFLTDDVYISGCQVENNELFHLLQFDDCHNITLDHCDFTGNRAVDAAFLFAGMGPVLDHCSFDGNNIHTWYVPMTGLARSPEGDSLFPDTFPAYDPDNTELPPRKQVHVSSADGFLSAIASDTEIILDTPVLDLTTLSQEEGPNFYLRGGEDLVITGVDNFAVTTDADRNAHEILTGNQYASVLSFEACTNIFLSGFTAGHRDLPGECTGDVLWFNDVIGLTVENCGLYGCGVKGIDAAYCRNVTVRNCEIYECSANGICLYHVTGANLEDNIFRDLGGTDLELQQCETILVDGVPDFRAP